MMMMVVGSFMVRWYLVGSSSFRMMGSKERPKYGQNLEAAVDQN